MKRKVVGSGTQVKVGALISYVLIIINAAYGLIITPFILHSLGSSEYGVYKTIASLTNALMVMDLGLGGTVMRYIAKYRADKEDERISSFVSMTLCEAFVLIAAVIVVFGGIFAGLDTIYGSSFTSAELELTKKLFVILAFNVIFHILENVFNGILTGFNNFILANGIKLLSIIFRMGLILLILSSLQSAIALVLIDLGLTIATLIAEFVISVKRYRIKIRISFKGWDRQVFKESFGYTGLLFLTSIALQVNSNLDNTVIGAILGSTQVTIYSFGLTIFGMYEQLSTSISDVMLPTATTVVKEDKDGSKIHNLIVRTGRLQFLLLGATVTGFLVLGKDFLGLWLGDGFGDVYYIALILMLPSLFELCVNVCLSVLRARNMLKFRTGVLTSTTILNFLITVFGLYFFRSYYAAAIGTAASFVIGSLIIMNIYYYRKLGFHMIKIYASIVDRIWLCMIAAGVSTAVSSRFLNGSWLYFFINVIIFVCVYAITLLTFGLKRDEKKQLPIINKLMKQ
ncbi:MAG: oligosaccharide flippase family protein [Bacteroides fragilis]|nr:oligosaccharide flippase family protein [Bacteroides fragilis]